MYYWAKIIKNNDYNTFKKTFFILKFYNPSYLFQKQSRTLAPLTLHFTKVSRLWQS